jgi:hypothetical protein
MMSCLAHGLQQADSEIVRVSAEAVDALATHQISSGMPYPLKANHPDILNQFLEVLLPLSSVSFSSWVHFLPWQKKSLPQ